MVSLVKGSAAHTFGQQRPSQTGGHPIHVAPARDVAFRDLPPPTGHAPFRLDIKDVVSPGIYDAMLKAKKVTFHHPVLGELVIPRTSIATLKLTAGP